MKKKIDKKYLIYLIGILFITSFIFFLYRCYFSPDGSGYYYMSLMFNGEVSFKNWWTVRGFVYPLYIHIACSLFGKSILGVTISMYISYIMNLFMLWFLIKNVISEENYQKYKCKIIMYIFLLLILNPIIMGYSHCVLTETISPILATSSILIAYKWYYTDLNERKNNIIYLILISLNFILCWFLKQPYLIIGIISISLSLICKILKKISLKDFIKRVITLILSLFLLIASIKSWNIILKSNGLKSVNDSYLSTSFLQALSGEYEVLSNENKCDINNIKNMNLNKKEYTKLKILIENKKCDAFEIIKFNQNNKQNYKIVLFNNNNKALNSITFIIKEIIENPKYVIKSYFYNYLSTINLSDSYVTNNIYKSEHKFKSVEKENYSLALAPLKSGNVYWWSYYINENSYDEYKKNFPYASYMKQFESAKEYSDFNNNSIDFLYPLYSFIFKIMYLMCPFLFIYSIIKFFKKNKKIYFIYVLIFGTAFLYVLFYSITGAIIDRYAYTMYPLLLASIILYQVKEYENK